MDDLVTPRKIGEWLGQITAEIGQLVQQLGEADLDHSRKKSAHERAKIEYDRAYAIAFRQSSGSVEARRFNATEVCYGRRVAADEARKEADEAACKVRDLKEKISHARDRIDVGRSYGAALRAEAQVVGSPWTEG